MLGVSAVVLDEFAEALLGTCTPENVTSPAFVQAAMPPSRYRQVGVAGACQNICRARGQAVIVVAQHDVRVVSRGTSRAKRQLEPAQRYVARPQQMIFENGEFLAQIDQREFFAVAESWL